MSGFSKATSPLPFWEARAWPGPSATLLPENCHVHFVCWMYVKTDRFQPSHPVVRRMNTEPPRHCTIVQWGNGEG